MSFLNNFMEWSILSEQYNQSDELYYQSKLLQQQNENIHSLIEHQREQDNIRDYLYRINKCCNQLEKSKNKQSLDYYYSIYCLAKGINESGLSSSVISELKDKEYFDSCIEKISILMKNFAHNNKDKIQEYNNHIQNIEYEDIFEKLKKSEESRYNIYKSEIEIKNINEKIKDIQKVINKKPLKILICFIPALLISTVLAYLKYKYNFYIIKTLKDYGYYVICSLICFMGLIIASTVGHFWTKKSIKKHNIKMTSEEYNSLIQKKKNYINVIENLKNNISNGDIIYEYAYDLFPNLDFSDENYLANAEEIYKHIINKDNDIQNSLQKFKYSPDDIFENFFIYE